MSTTIDGFYERSEGTYRREDERVSIMWIHLNVGWRWWVYERGTSRDIGNPYGYVLLEDALEVARQH